MADNTIKEKRTKVKSAAFDYFEKIDNGKSYVCLIEIGNANSDAVCGKVVTISKGSKDNVDVIKHLKHHLQKHAFVFKMVEKKDNLQLTKQKKRVSTKKEKVTVAMNTEKLQRCIVDLVLKHSIPLTFFSNDTFTELIGGMAQKLEVSLDKNNIMKLVQDFLAKRESSFSNIICNQ